MTLFPAVLAFLVLGLDSPAVRPHATTRSTSVRPGLSWADADSLSRKLAVIEERHNQQKARKSQPVQVTQSELNSYLNLSYASELPKGLSNVEVRFGSGRIEAKGYVDVDQVKGSVPSSSSWGALSFLTGQVPIELSGKLVNQDGFGTVELESAYVASIRVPVAVVEQMVASSTRSEKHPEGYDIHSPFRLPYSVSRVRIEPGKATLEF
ncbi:MAG: hypothetical protein DMF77_09200 [Acidobacteria bacterium]|nr:MAG: hypothetical protein DMF77_09200 [Acidobacteriota bacterium]